MSIRTGTWGESGSTPAHVLLQAVLLGFSYYFLASPAAHLSMSGSLAAVIWPAPGIAVVLLWTLPYRKWPVYLLAVFVAMLFVGDLDHLPLKADLGFAFLNVFEVAFCAWVGRRFVSAKGELQSTAQLIGFILWLPIVACSVIAMVGASIAMLTMEMDWLRELRVFVVSNGLAILVIVPALLAWRHADASRERNYGMVAAVLAVMLASASIPDFSPAVLRALVALLLVGAAIQGGLRGASLAVLLAAASGIVLYLFGKGVYAQYADGRGVWQLQIDLSGLAVLSFFVAVAVQERQRLAERLERARRFEAMGMLAGGISHDFNNILGAIGGYAEIAKEKIERGESPGPAVQEIDAALIRGRDLTERILLAARRGDTAREMIDLRDVANEVIGLARAMHRKEVTIDIELPKQPLPVCAHRGQLSRAILNLVRNASQAAKSRVLLTAGSGSVQPGDLLIGDAPMDGEAAWVTVEDDGPGIAAEHLPHLFDPFFTTKSGSQGGTGLGLAIVAGVAAEHGGGVAVTTEPGVGTRFRFVLPSLPAAADGGTQPFGDGRRVLFAADHALGGQLEDWLAELGFEPVAHADARCAIVALADAPDDFDVLVAGAGGWSEGALVANIPDLRHRRPSGQESGDATLASLARAAGAVTVSQPLTRVALADALRTVLAENA